MAKIKSKRADFAYHAQFKRPGESWKEYWARKRYEIAKELQEQQKLERTNDTIKRIKDKSVLRTRSDPCDIVSAHHVLLKDDPDHLSSNFLMTQMGRDNDGLLLERHNKFMEKSNKYGFIPDDDEIERKRKYRKPKTKRKMCKCKKK